jgi:hypothetical protein
MDLHYYLDSPNNSYKLKNEGVYDFVTILSEDTADKIDLSAFDIAFLGVPFDENNNYDPLIADSIRLELTKLAAVTDEVSILDLGNLKKGKNVKDSLSALRDTLNYIVRHEIFVILISHCNHVKKALLENASSQDATKFVEVDSHFSIRRTLEYLNDGNQQQLNYTNIGYQSYYVYKDDLAWLKNNYFKAYRLGEVRNKISEIEPAIRDSHSINISLNALKYHEAPGQNEISPNGFYSEEICQIAKYSGAADYLKIANISDFLSSPGLQTIKLTAQIIWFLIYGYTIRFTEDPVSDVHIKKFNVSQGGTNDNIVFYKSEKTERWWMEIPLNEQKASIILPSNYEDYLHACNHQIPDRWLNAMQQHNFRSDI